MHQQIIKTAQQDFEKVIVHLSQEFAAIHTGRASTALIENINAEAYGVKQPLKGLAQITVSEATQLVIQPWDMSLVQIIENAIREKNLGFGLQNDGRLIRVNIPALTTDRRMEMTKLVSKTAEKAKIAIRNIREDARKAIKKLKDDKILSEDGLIKAYDDLQKIVDDINKKIDEMEKLKEKDITTI
ncbi:MAG: ribosome recycling factor [Patescibacteria group bacterium]|nr:ribosome recycling factor [Patescibacteria group bacterium]